MRKLPPLNSVRVFEAVGRRLSFKDAADELGVTTTAVSHQIRHLETYLGFKLVDRKPREITLTPAGREMFPKLKQGFDLMADAFDVLDHSKEEAVLRVTTTRAFADRWLLPRLAQFLKSNEGIKIEIDSGEDVCDLDTSKIDLAIRYGHSPPEIEDKDILFQDKFIAVSTDSKLQKVENWASERLLGFRWRNPDLGGPTWETWLTKNGYATQEIEIMQFTDESAAFDALDHGLGILLSSNVLLSEGLASGKYHRVDGPEMAGFTYYLQLAHGAQRKSAVRKFVAWLQEAADPSV